LLAEQALGRLKNPTRTVRDLPKKMAEQEEQISVIKSKIATLVQSAGDEKNHFPHLPSVTLK